MKRSGMDVPLHRMVGRFVPNLRQVWLRWRFDGNPFGNGYRQDIHITPAIIWTPWQRSVLATLADLGIVTHAGSVGIEWWTWRLVLSYGLSTQTPNKSGHLRTTEGRT